MIRLISQAAGHAFKHSMLAFCLLFWLVFGQLAISQEPHWKAVLMSASAEDGLENWDNARLGLQKTLVSFGVAAGDIVMLSAMDSHAGKSEGGSPVTLANSYNLRFALEDLHIQTGDAVLLFITSHGAENAGISLGRSQTFLSVAALNQILAVIPNQVPTVLLLSACYSGQFIQGPSADARDPPAMANLTSPYRIILTASRNDRVSFGCGPGIQTTVWDGVMLSELAKSGPSTSWRGFARAIQTGIEALEKYYSESDKSYPQSVIGTRVENLPFIVR